MTEICRRRRSGTAQTGQKDAQANLGSDPDRCPDSVRSERGVGRIVNDEDLGQTGDPEDLEQTVLAAHELERAVVCTDFLQAADQDPEFRKYFYTELLPTLRARGKTVLAVSHDDRYFSCADRVITMEQGQIRSVQRSADGAGP